MTPQELLKQREIAIQINATAHRLSARYYAAWQGGLGLALTLTFAMAIWVYLKETEAATPGWLLVASRIGVVLAALLASLRAFVHHGRLYSRHSEAAEKYAPLLRELQEMMAMLLASKADPLKLRVEDGPAVATPTAPAPKAEATLSRPDGARTAVVTAPVTKADPSPTPVNSGRAMNAAAPDPKSDGARKVVAPASEPKAATELPRANDGRALAAPAPAAKGDSPLPRTSDAQMPAAAAPEVKAESEAPAGMISMSRTKMYLKENQDKFDALIVSSPGVLSRIHRKAQRMVWDQQPGARRRPIIKRRWPFFVALQVLAAMLPFIGAAMTWLGPEPDKTSVEWSLLSGVAMLVCVTAFIASKKEKDE